MGENNNNILYMMDGEKTIRLDGLRTVDLQTESDCTPTINLNTEFKMTFRIHTPRSRKRFVKLLMASGISRNQANTMAASYHRHGYSWSNAYMDFLFLRNSWEV